MYLVLIRADGSKTIGLGHLTRQIDIANELRKLNYHVIFLSKDYLEGISLLKQNQFEIIKLNTEKSNINDSIKEINEKLSSANNIFDIIIVDLYKDFDNQDYLDNLKLFCKKLFVLSDEPKQFHIDVNGVFAFSENQESYDYKNFKTKYYVGLKYFPLNNKFQNLPKKTIKNKIKNILITFGGSDPRNYSSKIINPLKDLNINGSIILVLGMGYSNRNYNDLIKNRKKNIKIKINIKNMIDHLINSDLCICSAGNTLIEALTCGVPCIVLPQTQIEKERANALERNKMLINMNLDFTEEDLILKLNNLMEDCSLRRTLSINAQDYLDGKGLKRIVEVISKKE